MLKEIKISDWNAVKAEPVNGEDNAAIISFRLSNVIGMNLFLKLFQGLKCTIEDEKGFNFLSLSTYFINILADIYRSLKLAKQEEK